MQKDDLIRIHHMLDAAKEIQSFSKGKSRDDLNSDRMLVLSLVKDIEIIGEAASKIASGLRKHFGDIPRQDIIATRNHLIHAYFDIDLNIVWDTVIKDIPPLIKGLEKIISSKE
ncbi:DUF86 domain-containing protein [candidate division KSB1 bacterium]|nr:DUF86 domain-containing protein [candidate division KSB1 bacterium]NIR69628.1 DUF86 domain-containing protein [candidate division KSB1 bacterium]NIS25735.1 DUF86 domain-containing protein [candidate division KSB1 bacterium]NIT72602.1 DUF86 domain-containing protein [candidate division KSB1 bacterium]NIU26416.1 DUF86 domain-containing protein [candidate division KSB1 bacterium]